MDSLEVAKVMAKSAWQYNLQNNTLNIIRETSTDTKIAMYLYMVFILNCFCKVTHKKTLNNILQSVF